MKGDGVSVVWWPVDLAARVVIIAPRSLPSFGPIAISLAMIKVKNIQMARAIK